MIIHWKDNPLRTIVEVDDQDLGRMRAKITNNELYEFIFHLQFCATEDNKNYSSESVLKMVKEFDYKNIKKNAEEELERCVNDLKGIHIGDCTCIACTCTKCLAEDYLGINTIEGLGKHSAHYISSSFGSKDGVDTRTINEALDYLKNYKVEPYEENPAWTRSFTKEYYDSYIPKWTSDAKRAYDWLLNYKETKLK